MAEPEVWKRILTSVTRAALTCDPFPGIVAREGGGSRPHPLGGG
jgi:hypothetical protein